MREKRRRGEEKRSTARIMVRLRRRARNVTSHVVSDAPGALTWPGTSRWQLSFASTTQPEENAPRLERRGMAAFGGNECPKQNQGNVKEGRGKRERERDKERK